MIYYQHSQLRPIKNAYLLFDSPMGMCSFSPTQAPSIFIHSLDHVSHIENMRYLEQSDPGQHILCHDLSCLSCSFCLA